MFRSAVTSENDRNSNSCLEELLDEKSIASLLKAKHDLIEKSCRQSYDNVKTSQVASQLSLSMDNSYFRSAVASKNDRFSNSLLEELSNKSSIASIPKANLDLIKNSALKSIPKDQTMLMEKLHPVHCKYFSRSYYDFKL